MRVDHGLAVRLAERLYEKGRISWEKHGSFKASHPDWEKVRRAMDEVEEVWER